MTEIRRFGLGDVLLLVVVLAVAGGARTWYVGMVCRNGTTPGPFQVQEDRHREWDELAANIKRGQGFFGPAPLAAKNGETTAHTAPGYPWLLAQLDRALPAPEATHQMIRWLQCGLGALTAGLYFLFARRAFRSRLVGLLTGLLTACYPFWIVSTAEIEDGVLATFALASCLFLGGRAGQGARPLTSLLYGVALAGLALVRATFLPFAFVGMLWFMVRCRTLQRGWLYALLAFLGFTNGLLPWSLRNFRTFGDVVPIADSAYLHLWMGNNPQADGGPLTDAKVLTTLAAAREKDEATLAKELGDMKQAARYRSLGPDALEEIRAHPAETMQRRLQAGLFYFLGAAWVTGRPQWYETSGTQANDGNAEAGDVPDWLTQSAPALAGGSLLGMLAGGLLGWRWSYGWRSPAMPSSLALIWIPLPYLLGHAGTLHGPRLPLDGILLAYVALVIASVIPLYGPRLFRGEEAGGSTS